MIKKLSIFVVIISFLYLTVGYFYVYKSIQNSIKREIKHLIRKGISDEKLEKFYFNKTIFESEYTNFKWLKKNKEFLFNNKMYDVVRVLFTGDSVTLLCVNDIDEERLVSNFNLFKLELNSTKIPIKNIIQNCLRSFSFNYLLPDNSYSFKSEITNNHIALFTNIYTYYYLDKIHIPPNCITYPI